MILPWLKVISFCMQFKSKLLFQILMVFEHTKLQRTTNQILRQSQNRYCLQSRYINRVMFHVRELILFVTCYQLQYWQYVNKVNQQLTLTKSVIYWRGECIILIRLLLANWSWSLNWRITRQSTHNIGYRLLYLTHTNTHFHGRTNWHDTLQLMRPQFIKAHQHALAWFPRVGLVCWCNNIIHNFL